MLLKNVCFVWLQKLVRVNQSMDDAKYRTILEENLLEAEISFIIFQQDNNPKHTAWVTNEQFKPSSYLRTVQ